MPLRFRRSVKIAPGVQLNIGKKSGSVTFGKRGASVNFGKRGAHGNVGIPGTGLSYRSKLGGSSTVSNSTNAKKPRPSDSGKTQIGIEISLLDDGSITFKDENGNFLPDEWVRKAKSQNRDLILDWLQKHCDENNEEISSLLNIHLSTPSLDTQIIFEPAPLELEEPVPPQNEFQVPCPEPPREKQYGFLASKSKLRRNRIDKRNHKAHEKYEAILNEWQREKEEFEAEYEIKYRDYVNRLNSYNESKEDFTKNQEERRKFIEEERLHNPEAMEQFLEEVLPTIIWPQETLISFDIIDDGKEVLIDVHLPEIEDLPEIETKVNKRDYKLSFVPISQTQKRKNYFTHIHSIGFRLIGEVFVSLPSVNFVVLSGYSNRISKSTGNLTPEYLYSVRVNREKWDVINFQNLDMIDVVSCFEEFDLRRKATKTGIMKPIEPF